MANMAYEIKVQEKLGEDVLKIILDSVTEGTIDAQKMYDFAFKLHLAVGGGHKTRMALPGKLPDQSEMRQILCDWYNEELHDMDQNTAVERLATAFQDQTINLPPLAQQLRRKLEVKGQEEQEGQKGQEHQEVKEGQETQAQQRQGGQKGQEGQEVKDTQETQGQGVQKDQEQDGQKGQEGH